MIENSNTKNKLGYFIFSNRYECTSLNGFLHEINVIGLCGKSGEECSEYTIVIVFDARRCDVKLQNENMYTMQGKCAVRRLSLCGNQIEMST